MEDSKVKGTRTCYFFTKVVIVMLGRAALDSIPQNFFNINYCVLSCRSTKPIPLELNKILIQRNKA